MSFILSSCRQSDNYSPKLFDKYLEYLYSVREVFPKSAFEFASNIKWYEFGEDSPHDAPLLSLKIEDYWAQQESEESHCTISIALRFTGNKIKVIRYTGIDKYVINHDDGPTHGGWRYDEFSLSEPGIFLHTIEWGCGARWEICAREIHIE